MFHMSYYNLSSLIGFIYDDLNFCDSISDHMDHNALANVPPDHNVLINLLDLHGDIMFSAQHENIVFSDPQEDVMFHNF